MWTDMGLIGLGLLVGLAAALAGPAAEASGPRIEMARPKAGHSTSAEAFAGAGCGSRRPQLQA